MGELFGLVNTNGHAVSRDQQLQTEAYQAKRYPTLPLTICRDQALLGFQPCFASPEYSPTSLPATIAHICVISSARIDNREALAKTLGIPQEQAQQYSDNWLIARCYLEWGRECPVHLQGDFSFAVWDSKSRSLFLARDQFGSGQIYYHQSESRLIFSSSLAGLLSCPEIPREVNPRAIASSLTLIPTGNYSETVYLNVCQIPPGHTLTQQGNQLNLRQFWSFAQIRPVRYQRSEEYLEAFHEIFSTAVGNRLRSNKPVGVLLSGGVDSGSVAVEAARQLGERGQTLHAYTAAPHPGATIIQAESEVGDETQLARLTCSKHPNIRHTIVVPAVASPIEAIDKTLQILGHPHFSATNCHWILAISEAMQQQGLGVALNGQCGNASISWPGNRSRLLRELLMSGQFGRYSRELGDLRRGLKMNLTRSLASLVVAPLLPAWVYAGLQKYRSGEDFCSAGSPINPEFARQIHLRQHAIENGVFRKHLHNPDYRNYFLHWGKHSLTSVGAALSAPFGLDRRDPTSDLKLIEFCFGIPESEYIIEGQPRQLIRRAMLNQLPAEVLFNRKRGSQSADTVWRVRKHASDIEDALLSAEKYDLPRKYLDMKKIRQVFEQALSDDSVDCRVAVQSKLLSGLVMCRFLRQFEN